MSSARHNGTLGGRVIAVTGGARGIGAAIAVALGRAGARVAVGDLDRDGAERTAAEAGNGAVGLHLDVASTDSFAAFLDVAEQRFGPLDVLVNNAGIMYVGAFHEEPEATALRQFDVNLHGVLRGMKLAIPRMRERGRGHVVNVASAASKVAPAGEATYTATKHAVYGLSAAVRAEIAGSGVHISVVMPAVVETELAAGTSSGSSRRLGPDEVAAGVVKVLLRPRFEVFVPRRLAPLSRLVAVLPPRAQDALVRRIVPDQLKESDHEARAAYEAEMLPGAGVRPEP